MSLQLDSSLKQVTPGNGLRRWFSHDKDKWDEFRRRYFAELENRADEWEPILDASRRGTVTLLYSAYDQGHNNAVALRQYLEEKLHQKPFSAAA